MLFQHKLHPEQQSVRGTLVTGLSDEDMALIDLFEGEVNTLVNYICR